MPSGVSGSQLLSRSCRAGAVAEYQAVYHRPICSPCPLFEKYSEATSQSRRSRPGATATRPPSMMVGDCALAVSALTFSDARRRRKSAAPISLHWVVANTPRSTSHCSGASSEEQLTRSGGDQPWPTRSVHHFPGGTKDRYRGIRLRRFIQSGSSPPARPDLPRRQSLGGQLGRSWPYARTPRRAGSGSGTKEFLMPRIKQGIEGGLGWAGPETAFEVHNLQR